MSTGRIIADARRQTLDVIPRRSAARYPDREALIDGDVRLTYRELVEAVDRVAAGMVTAGLQPGDTLAILSRNCWQFVVISYATARLGIVLVPINYMLGPEEIAYILDHSGSDGLVAEDGFVEVAERGIEHARVPVHHRATIRLGTGPGPEGWQDVATWIAHARVALPATAVTDDQPLRLMYTSGTESRPKGTMLSSRSLMWQYVSCIVAGEFRADDVELHALPLYHCAQLDTFLNPSLYLGATNVIVRSPEPATLLRTIERERITKMFSPPTVWIDLLRSPEFDTRDVSSLRKVYYGASAMPTEILEELGRRLPGVRLWNLYGQTEMGPIATASPPEDQLTHPGSAGLPALNVETRVVDDDGADVPLGEVGEIVHRSAHLMVGYHDDPERTAEAFRDGWFHSGDLGRFDEGGRLYIVDRKKDMIKTGGENVASREVEEVLYRHPGISEVAVFGLPHPRFVEAVTAVVVPREGHELDPDQIAAHCRASLAGYKTPKRVLVVDELPKNPSGKILKRELRDRYAGLADTEPEEVR